MGRKKIRVAITYDPGDIAFVEEMAKAHRISKAEVYRQAMRMYRQGKTIRPDVDAFEAHVEDQISEIQRKRNYGPRGKAHAAIMYRLLLELRECRISLQAERERAQRRSDIVLKVIALLGS